MVANKYTGPAIACPRCSGSGEVLDNSRCGPSCRSIDPPQRACGLCGGSGVTDTDTADEYGDEGDGRDYEGDFDDGQNEARWEAQRERNEDR